MQDGLNPVLDYTDYLAISEDGKRYEIIAGNLFMTPAPRPVHQRVVARLFLALHEHFGSRTTGEVFIAPIDLILTEHDVMQPDLLVVDDRTTITDRGIEGAPLLVVEVLSDGTAERDRGVKFRRYAELGVRHCWLVDPGTKRVECYRLAGGTYEPSAAVAGNAALAVPGFAGLSLPLAALWAESEAPERS